MRVFWSWMTLEPFPLGITATVDGGPFALDVTYELAVIPRGVAVATLLPTLQTTQATSSDDGEPPLKGFTIYLDLNGNDRLNPLNGPWTLTYEKTTDDGTVVSDSFIFDDPKIPDVREAISEIMFDGVEGAENHEPDTSKLPTIDAGAEGVDGAHVVSGPVSSFIWGDLNSFDFTESVLEGIKQTVDEPYVDLWTVMIALPDGATHDGHAVFMGFTGRVDFKDDIESAIEDNGGEFRDLPADQASINALTNEWAFLIHGDVMIF